MDLTQPVEHGSGKPADGEPDKEREAKEQKAQEKTDKAHCFNEPFS